MVCSQGPSSNGTHPSPSQPLNTDTNPPPLPRTGHYKRLSILSVAISSLGYLALLLRWHGHTNWLESLYIIPGGFGTGMAQSALFISLQAVIADPAHMSPAVSFMYLSGTVR